VRHVGGNGLIEPEEARGWGFIFTGVLKNVSPPFILLRDTADIGKDGGFGQAI